MLVYTSILAFWCFKILYIGVMMVSVIETGNQFSK